MTRQCDVAEEIRSRLGTRPHALVGLDGVNGVGKTTLARTVSAQLGCKFLSLDDYLTRKQDRYFDALRFDELRSAIARALGEESLVIVEGICLLAVLDRIGVRQDLLVYAKRRSKAGHWVDESELAWDGSEDELVSTITEKTLRMRDLMRGRFGKTTSNPPFFRLEVARYHYRWRPFEKADITVDMDAD